MFYLQNVGAGYLGNSPVFYGKAGAGYTQWLDEAEQFDSKAATLLIRSTCGSHQWKRWPVKLLDSKARRTVDIQDLR